MRVGLIVNPIAGIGGRVGLKGSDGVDIQNLAIARGAQPKSHLRAAQALEILRPWQELIELVTPPKIMGEKVACQCGFTPRVIGKLASGPTCAEDSRRFAQEMLNLPVDLLLFTGGDGTARDIYTVVGMSIPVLGIPAGVKIHSAVFATNPHSAGEIISDILRGERIELRESEVVDLDEETYRTGIITTRLMGYLRVPFRPHRLQNRKIPTPATESARLEAIAADVVESMQPRWLYVLGPGTTTRAITDRLGFPKTLVGVDVYNEGVIAWMSAIPTAGFVGINLPGSSLRLSAGFIFGRGNQPINPRVIQMVGRENIRVVCLSEKLNALRGEPLLVDTGDPEVDNTLAGSMHVVVGYREKVMYRVST
jgi:predicted polyphosphate/ATP-dependent NAD kinase